MSNLMLAALQSGASTRPLCRQLLSGDEIQQRVAARYLPSIPQSRLVTCDAFDNLVIEASRQVADGESFAHTELFDLIDAIVTICDEVLIWYDQYFEHLLILRTREELLAYCDKQIRTELLEIYCHYKPGD